MKRSVRIRVRGTRSPVRCMLSAAGACVLALTSLVQPPAAVADTRGDAQMLVDKAVTTFGNFSADPNMTWFRNHVKNAKGLLIVPELLKGGFIVGGSGGGGVLLARGADGTWSYPAFYNMGSVSFGLQLGAELAEVVLMVMTDRGMDAMYSTEFKLGADASIAAGPVGAGAQAATADVLAFSRAKGAFGGLTLEGAVLGASGERNEAYYGRAVRPLEILSQRKVRNPGADRLRAALAGGAGARPAAAPPAPGAAGGYDLLTIQQLLKAKGFDPGTPDGRLGPATRRAISDYQSKSGLPVTGEPSLELQRALVGN